MPALLAHEIEPCMGKPTSYGIPGRQLAQTWLPLSKRLPILPHYPERHPHRFARAVLITVPTKRSGPVMRHDRLAYS